MLILEQIVIWLPATLPLILVLGYGAYQYVKCYKLRKRNRQKLANFNNMIAQALNQDKRRS